MGFVIKLLKIAESENQMIISIKPSSYSVNTKNPSDIYLFYRFLRHA